MIHWYNKNYFDESTDINNMSRHAVVDKYAPRNNSKVSEELSRLVSRNDPTKGIQIFIQSQKFSN